MFSLWGFIYLAITTVNGKLIDSVAPDTIVILIIIANAWNAIAIALPGPLPAMNLAPNVHFLYAFAIFISVGMGIAFAACIKRMHNAIERFGYSTSSDHKMMITSLWMTSIQVGSLIGPIIGGILVDWIGFDPQQKQ